MVDARLPDGSRVNIIFPPLAIDSPCLSIRKFPSRRLGLTDMVGNGTMTSGIARLLGIAARARLNVLISGGIGSGKTTLLNAMAQHDRRRRTDRFDRRGRRTAVAAAARRRGWKATAW